MKKIILEGCSYRHVKRTISNFDTSGVSSLSAKECNRERELVLKQLFSPVLREYFQEAEQLKKLPLLDVFLRLSKTRRLQYRIKPLLWFILKTDDFFLVGSRAILKYMQFL